MKLSYKKNHLTFLKFKRDFQKYSLQKIRSYELVIHWLNRRLTRSQFLILSGILVGCTAGLAGVVLKSLVHYIHHFITTKVHFESQILFYIIFPFLGIVLTTLIVHFIFRGQDRKGISAILYEIAKNSSIVSSVKMYSQIIQSAVTVGLGGSAGLESPIAVTGAAIGSNFAQTYKLAYRERTLLLAAGATAGIASAFNAPIAGMMFAFEILLTGVIFSDFIPLVVAAVCGSLISRILLQEDILFRFHTRGAFNYHNIPYYLVLGVLTGIYARYFLTVSHRVDIFFHKRKITKFQKAILGGLALSVLCLLLPPLFGEGYDTIKAFTNGETDIFIQNSFFRYFEFKEWGIIIFLVLICLLKAFATAITIFSGGNGGNFAPSLFAGGTLGFLFATICVQLGLNDVPVTNLVLVGMAGVMSGALYAPLTAIFLIAESSSGYDLFIPLMIVSVISFLMARWFSPISPELKSLADQGKIFTHEHDRNLLAAMQIKDLVDVNAQRVNENDTFNDFIEKVKTSKKNVFAITNDDANLVGILTMDDIRPILFNKELISTLTVRQLMREPIVIAHEGDDMYSVVKVFDESGIWYLPVIDDDECFIGFISKSDVLQSYRTLLKGYTE